MKHIKILCIGLLCLLSVNISAQSKKEMLDTVNINCNEKLLVSLVTHNGSSFKTDTGLRQLFTGMQTNIRRIADNLPSDGNYKLIYYPGKSIVIERLAVANKFIVREDSVRLYLWNNECEIRTDERNVLIHFKDYRDLLSNEIMECVTAGIEKLPAKTRYAQSYHYAFRENVLTETADPTKTGYQMDMLNLTGGFGASVLKGKLVTDLGMEMGLNFNNKGILRNAYYVSGNLMYLFDDPATSFDLYGFVNAGYRRNLSNEPYKTSWLGVELGVPLKREGFFKEDMLRMGVRWELGKSMYVTGQLYIQDNFKSAYPALRFSIWF